MNSSISCQESQSSELVGVTTMVVSEVTSVGTVVLQAAEQIQKLGENWYRASKDWEDFPRKVENLRRSYHVWREESQKFGMLSDRIFQTTLEEAKVLLKKVEAELQRRDRSRVAGCWPKLCMTVFPVMIGQTVQSVTEAFDNIPKTLKMKEEARTAMEKASSQKLPSSGFRDDDRYVSLEETESAVYSALEAVDNRNGPTVVLLHGGPGKGKSTLTRHAAVHYENLRKKSKGGQDEGAHFQHGVIYLECSQSATPLLKQVELLQLLGMEAADQQSDRDSKISGKLRSALESRKVLIIFDDVSDKKFLQEMLGFCGDGVKCLVTSQNRGLCWGLQCAATEIRIEDVKPEVGRKILASYVFRRGNQQIPERILGVADEIVQECQGNPLALASVSMALRKDPDELTEWENAKETLLTLLKSKDTPELLGRNYPRSFVSAAQLPLKTLEEEGRNLLILVHLCATPVPEEVVHVLHKRIQGSRTFQVLRNELEDRELIKITSQFSAATNSREIREKSWSVHSLRRQFMREDVEMRKLQENIFASILSGASSAVNMETRVEPEIVTEFSTDEDARVTIAMCSLYLDREFALQAASKMGVNHDRFEEKFNSLRRNAIEPVTRLLGQPVSQRWTPDSQALTKQVFLEYICNGRPHKKGIMHLGRLIVSKVSIRKALNRFLVVEMSRLGPVLKRSSVTASHGLLKIIIKPKKVILISDKLVLIKYDQSNSSLFSFPEKVL